MTDIGQTSVLHSYARAVLEDLDKSAEEKKAAATLDPMQMMAAQAPGPSPTQVPGQMPQQPMQPQMPGQMPQQQMPAKGGGKQQQEERLANIEAALAELLKAQGMADPEKALAAKIVQQPGAQAPAGGGPVIANGPLDPMGAQAMQQMKFGSLITEFQKSGSFEDPADFISGFVQFMRGYRAAR